MSTIYDVIVIGGGIAGLMTAQKLSDLGMRVALIEEQAMLASGPSTKNEGWLHRGTYHAASIKDRATAIQVARRCIYGHEQLRRFCPEAIEDADVRPLVMVRQPDNVDEVISRWQEAEVQFSPITHAAAKQIVPDADFSRTAAIFKAGDVSLNTRLLYRKLFTLAQKAGCDFYIGHKVRRIEGQSATLEDDAGKRTMVEAPKFVYSTGAGTKSTLKDLHDIELPIRYWKSHLIITRRLAPVGLFYVDPHEAAMMHHGDKSIIGLNEDALLCPSPSYEVIADRARNLRTAVRRIFPEWNSSKAVDIACTKVDIAGAFNSSRSLNIAIIEPIDSHIVILPGKMTETPYLTDVLTSRLHERLDDSPISLRPCDHFRIDDTFLEVI